MTTTTAAPFAVPAYATMWLGTTRTVPVYGFECTPDRTIFDVATPQGRFEVWATVMRDDVMVNIYDADGNRIWSGDGSDGRDAQEQAAVWLSEHRW